MSWRDQRRELADRHTATAETLLEILPTLPPTEKEYQAAKAQVHATLAVLYELQAK